MRLMMRLKSGLLAAASLLAAIAPSGGLAQQAPAPSVSPLVVAPPDMVPVPKVGEGAPLLTPREIESIRQTAVEHRFTAQKDLRGCTGSSGPSGEPPISNAEVDHVARAAAMNGGKILLGPPFSEGGYLAELMASNLIARYIPEAVKATAAAEQARRQAAQGLADQRTVEETELARQKIVTRLTTATAMLTEARALTAETQEARRRGGDPIRDLSRRYIAGVLAPRETPEYAKVELLKIESSQETDRTGAFISVTGQIRNGRDRAIGVPPLSLTVVDDLGFPLKSEVAEPPDKRMKIEPGQLVAFAYKIRPQPRNGGKVVVGFGSNRIVPPRVPESLFCRPGGG